VGNFSTVVFERAMERKRRAEGWMYGEFEHFFWPRWSGGLW
jgi:hypothetical protein